MVLQEELDLEAQGTGHRAKSTEQELEPMNIPPFRGEVGQGYYNGGTLN
jgi:hypothetical protein